MGQRSSGFIEWLPIQLILPNKEQILFTEGWLTDGITAVTSY